MYATCPQTNELHLTCLHQDIMRIASLKVHNSLRIQQCNPRTIYDRIVDDLDYQGEITTFTTILAVDSYASMRSTSRAN